MANKMHDLPASSGRGGTVLVADDTDLMRIFLQRYLEMEGFSVLVAKDGLEAVEMFRKHRTQIRGVLLDINMPNLSGDEALILMRRMQPDVPAILSSAFVHESIVCSIRSPGPTAFLSKPYPPHALLEKLREILPENAE